MNELDVISVLFMAVNPSSSHIMTIKEIEKSSSKLNKILRFAKNNGLFYYFISELSGKSIYLSEQLKKYRAEEERKLSVFKNTLAVLNAASAESGIPYILFKDKNTVSHIPRDVDIFVRMEEKDAMIMALCKAGMECEHSGDIETTVIGKSLLPVDLYTKIIHFNKEIFDQDYLFSSVKRINLFGTEYPCLNNEAAFSLTLMHSLFGHRCINLLDMIHLNNISNSELTIEDCRVYAKRMGWGRVFNSVFEKFQILAQGIGKSNCRISFPYLFDIKFMMECVRQIDGISLSTSDDLLIRFSLFLDSSKLKLESTSLADWIRKIPILRNSLLSLGYFSRSARGDKYS